VLREQIAGGLQQGSRVVCGVLCGRLLHVAHDVVAHVELSRGLITSRDHVGEVQLQLRRWAVCALVHGLRLRFTARWFMCLCGHGWDTCAHADEVVREEGQVHVVQQLRVGLQRAHRRTQRAHLLSLQGRMTQRERER
jgi:hypothetical protein